MSRSTKPEPRHRRAVEPAAGEPSVPRPVPKVDRSTMALATADDVELEIEKLVAGGDGFGRWQGIPLFVARSAPGDRLRVRITERRASYGRAEIVEILAPGPGRRTPPCPHFGECGGCDLQHLDEATQLRAKVEAALETLRRISKLSLPEPGAVVVGEPFGYRLRTQVHLATGASGVSVGYHARRTRRLVPVSACPVLVPDLESAVLGLARTLAPPVPSRVVLAVGDGGEVAAAPPLPDWPGRELERRIGEITLRYDARCFVQGHAALLPQLVDIVIGDASGELAFDLYGGVGLFAAALSRRYRRVVLVEGDRVAARYARKNAAAAGPGTVEVEATAVESWAPRGLREGADRVVVDPPRDGLPMAVRRALLARPPVRLTYVSCHPAALARDLADLATGFAVESLRFVDLFPQTGHLESIVQLERKVR